MSAGPTMDEVRSIERQLKSRFADTIHRISVLKQRSRLKEWDGGGDNTPFSDRVDASRAAAEHGSERDESSRLMATAVQLQSALKRIQTGAYGRCLDCGGPIAPERLRVLPETGRCVTCETRQEAGSAGASI